MARTLTAELDRIMLSQERRPGWRVEVFDIRSSVSDTIGRIVRGLTLEDITGPRDFTSDARVFRRIEVASDYVSIGVAVPSLTFDIVDPNGEFDSVENPAPAEGRWLRRGNVVRLYEGDRRVDSSLWPCTFTGKLVGQPGVDLNRTGVRADTTVKALGRENGFLNLTLTSDNYSIGVTLKSIATDIAQSDMGLDSEEIDWINWGAQTNGHLSLQFVELPPLVAIANLMMIDGLMPRFNGEGKLTQSQGLVTQNPDRVFSNRRQVRSIVRPFSEADPVNSVLVLGLDTETTEIAQPSQPLTELHITTGYFTPDEAIPVFFSDDHRVMARNVTMQVVKSTNGGLSLLGGGESFSEIAAPIGTGAVGVTIEISSGYAPYVIIFLTSVYISLAAIPDEVVTAEFVGFTIPYGRISQATALAVIMILMTKIGKGHYIFQGEPFENVFLELRREAELEGLTTETRKSVTIMNQALQTQADVDSVAQNTLFRQQALALVRAVEMLTDLRLEADDVFEIPGPRRFQIQQIEVSGERGAQGARAAISRLVCSELSALGFE